MNIRKKDGRANRLAILLYFYENGQILLIQLIMILSIGQSLISQLLLPSAKANIHKNIKFDVVIDNNYCFQNVNSSNVRRQRSQ